MSWAAQVGCDMGVRGGLVVVVIVSAGVGVGVGAHLAGGYVGNYLCGWVCKWVYAALPSCVVRTMSQVRSVHTGSSKPVSMWNGRPCGGMGRKTERQAAPLCASVRPIWDGFSDCRARMCSRPDWHSACIV